MINVVYVAPYFTPNAIRFLEGLISLHTVRLVIICQESTARLPSWQISRIAHSQVVSDVLMGRLLIDTLRPLVNRFGSFHRILGATEQLQVPLAEVREALGIEGMNVETALQFRDKSRMKIIFEKAGIPCARHSLAYSLEDTKKFKNICPYPWVAKPVAGAGSITTFKIESDEELVSAFRILGDEVRTGVILEEFILGDEYSLDTFSKDGKILGQTINQYFPTPLEVMNNPWMQWRVLLRKDTLSKEFDDIRKAGKKALDVLGMKTGMTHMEWFRRKDGSVAISEVAARPPGAQFTTLISRACDFDVVKAWIELMIKGETEIPGIQYACGAAYLRGQGKGRVKHVEGLEMIRNKYNDIITDIRVPKTGQEKSISYEGEGFIILRHPDPAIVENALADIVSNVRVILE